MGFYIYLIQCAESAYYKIGIAGNPEQRLETLQIGCPYELRLILTCRMNSKTAAATAEVQIHNKLNRCRVGSSEWFALDGASLDQLKRDMINNSEIDH